MGVRGVRGRSWAFPPHRIYVPSGPTTRTQRPSGLMRQHLSFMAGTLGPVASGTDLGEYP